MSMLVAGVGNIFLSDDAFGVEVIRALGDGPAPAGVKIVDFGIRGVHLAYELLDGYDVLVLVDAAPRGETPGTVSLVEVEQAAIADASAEVAGGERPMVDAHGLEPGAILQMLGSLGGQVETVLVVACEPQSVEEGLGLSPAVAAAVPEAVQLVRKVMSERATASEVSR